MKNKKTAIMMSLSLIIIFIVGCTPSSQPVVDVDYRKGSEGLRMEFIENMPTRSVFAGERFNIGLMLENVGAHDIGQGKITISGYERSQYDFAGGNQQTFQLRGKTQYEQKGEIDQLVFDVQSLCYPAMAQQIRTNLTTTFRATACYTYATVANAQVCIDTNPLVTQTATKKVCQPKTITLSGGQGGPVAVTKVEPTMIPTGDGNVRARFLIHLRNLNTKGTVYSTAALDGNCEDSSLQNKVYFGASLSDMPMYCTPQGEIELRLGEDTIVSCEIDLGPEGGVYETQLTMGMEYAYSHDVTKKINVNKPLDVNIPACS